MPKPVKKRPEPQKKSKKPSSDPMVRARQLMAEHMEKAESGPKPWDKIPAAPDFQAQFTEHMRKLGAQGGRISGAKRMTNLSDEQRREIALKAARSRWAKKRPKV